MVQASQARIVVSGLSKRFSTGTLALSDINLAIADGEFVAIVGPSGSGKTTLLRIAAGLETPSSGSITIRAVEQRCDALPAAVVFQEQSLLPWKRVRDNVEIAFDSLSITKAERRRRSEEQLALVGLANVADAYPHQLSGGMKQRTAVARAFAVDPQVLFMDEPFGALDEQTRVALAGELLALWDRTRKTVLFVTHSIEEAVTLADRVVVLAANPGRVHAVIDIPFDRPRDPIELRADPRFGRIAVDIWHLLRPQASSAP